MNVATQRPTVNFTGNLTAADNSGANRTDVTLKSDVTGLSSLSLAQSSTTAGALTSTANSAFTRGTGTGFYYNGTTGSLVGANTISSTGAFTGTLFALTADSTQSGTILGISGQSLTSGKAIDVSLGAAYNLSADATGASAGAVNVRAGAYNGNIFNVLSTANVGATTMNLANLESGQTDGQLLKIRTSGAYAGSAGTGVLNIDANSATGGTIARLSATGLTGTGQVVSITLGASSSATGIFANTGTSYTGNIIDLQANSASQFKVDATKTTLGGSLLGSNATSFDIDHTGALPINIGKTTASQVNIARSGILTNVGGTLTAASTFTVTGTTPASALVVSPVGGVTAQGVGTFGPTAGNQLVVQGAAAGTGVQVRASGTDTNVGLSLTPKGTSRVNVVGSSGGLDVDNDVVAGAALANHVQLVGGATTVPVSMNATGIDTNITLQLAAKGTGTVQITGAGGLNGPAASTFVVDAASGQAITIGGTNGTTLNLGRTGQVQALKGNVTVAGTLTGPVAGTFTIDNGSASPISIGGTTATTLNLGRSGQLQALLGNVTVGGTLKGPGSAVAFQIDNGSNASLDLGTLATTTVVNIGRTGAVTNVLGDLVLTGVGHILTTTTLVPSIVSNTGTTCTFTANSTDTAGRIQVVATNALAANQTMCTITFATPYSGYAPTILITAGEINSASLANTKAPYVTNMTTTGWILKSNGTSMGVGTFTWNYLVIR